MQYTALLIAATAATASAQFTYNSTTGVFTCPPDHLNGAYCAGGSLSTNIIIRCNNGVGQPGNCNDNLAGYCPIGVNYAPCWETSETSGDAACSKNCIVEGGSGASNGTFTLPNCTPTATCTTPTTSPTSTVSSTSGSATTTTVSVSTTTSVSCSTSAGSSTTITTTYVPPTTSSTTAGPTGGSSYSSNSTITTSVTAGGSTSATNTPVGPSGTTSAPPSTFTGGAVANSAGLSLAAVGIFAAYLL